MNMPFEIIDSWDAEDGSDAQLVEEQSAQELYTMSVENQKLELEEDFKSVIDKAIETRISFLKQSGQKTSKNFYKDMYVSIEKSFKESLRVYAYGYKHRSELKMGGVQ